MASEVGTPAARRRKLHALCDSIGLTREERIEISRVILWRDVTSWSNLDDAQVNRLLDVLEGWIVVQHTLSSRASVAQ